MHVDQFAENALARDASARYGALIYRTIRAALTLGGPELAVDGVLLIGEHGDYPENEIGQKMYPRRRFFEEATGVMRKPGGVVPTFSDKHLSYAWEEARATWREARELELPFMAGSSLPVTWRRPPLELPSGCSIDEALVVGYGPLESYGFHALETLQCMVERRGRGEVGVAAVQCLRGPAVWEAAGAGRWSRELEAAALARAQSISQHGTPEAGAPAPAAFLIEYRDGLRATVLMLDRFVSQFTFAARVGGENVSTALYLQSTEP